jgi:6-phosphogluconolactonase (cycloisomerase 2 family)
MRSLSAALCALALVLNGCKSGEPSWAAALNVASVLIVPYSTIVGDVQRSNSVSVYKIAASGDLTLVAGSPFAAGSEPILAAVAPSGGFAYVVNGKSNNVSAYKIDARTGALTQVRGSPFSFDYSPYGPTQIVIDPHGSHAYVVSDAGVSGFSIDAATGALKRIAGSPFAAERSQGIGITAIAIDPSDRFAYVLDYFRNTISTYEIDAAGALKPAGSPLDAGQNSNSPGFPSVTIDPKGKFAYVTGNDRYVFIYAINATTGALTPSAHLGLGEPGVFELGRFAIDPSGRFAYAIDRSSGHVYAYGIDPTTGRLRPLARGNYSRNAGSQAYDLTIDPTGAFAYALNPRTIYAYRIDAAGGQLTPLARSPFTVAANTVDPVARWFNAGFCSALRGEAWTGAQSPPVAKRDSDLIFNRGAPMAPGYFYDPKRHIALHNPRGDVGGTITLRVAGEPPRDVPRRDLSMLATAAGIKLGSRAEMVVNLLGEPKIVKACNEQGYVYQRSRDGEPLSVLFVITNGIVTGISWERGG